MPEPVPGALFSLLDLGRYLNWREIWLGLGGFEGPDFPKTLRLGGRPEGRYSAEGRPASPEIHNVQADRQDCAVAVEGVQGEDEGDTRDYLIP